MKNLLFIIFLFGCVPVNHAFFTMYTVPKHQNYSVPRATIQLPTNLVRWQFKTNDTWNMEQANNGISKVGGIFWGGIHSTSVRIGYQDWNGEQWLWYYVYENGTSPQEDKRLKNKLCQIEIGKTYSVSTGYACGCFVIEIDDSIIEIETGWKPNAPSGFACPYIGGSYTIGHKWEVPIKLN